jgi:hypothetical protein
MRAAPTEIRSVDLVKGTLTLRPEGFSAGVCHPLTPGVSSYKYTPGKIFSGLGGGRNLCLCILPLRPAKPVARKGPVLRKCLRAGSLVMALHAVRFVLFARLERGWSIMDSCAEALRELQGIASRLNALDELDNGHGLQGEQIKVVRPIQNSRCAALKGFVHQVPFTIDVK